MTGSTNYFHFLYKFLVILVFTPTCFALNILISDIDDTLKDSKTRDFWTMMWRGRITDSTYLIPGMDTALNYLVDEAIVDQVYYVSKIPSLFGNYHLDFLANNKFPNGALYARGFEGDSFKERAIKEIIEKQKPASIIFIGDNTEEDPAVFYNLEQLLLEKGIGFKVYIRTAYNKDFYSRPNQEKFLDGHDLLTKLP